MQCELQSRLITNSTANKGCGFFILGHKKRLWYFKFIRVIFEGGGVKI